MQTLERMTKCLNEYDKHFLLTAQLVSNSNNKFVFIAPMKILSHSGVTKKVVETKLNAIQVGQYICEMQAVTIKGKLTL